ncbi:MAG: GntR family transcriptional regulator [Clostridia bacterium]|nr:GntR family transcriptional regulator [Clostridia bacterium]
MGMLDANNAVPLYEQLKLELHHRIDDRMLQPGDRLPSEAELCQEFGISRITVRRAIEELVEEGCLERRHGKGTFVAQRPTELYIKPIDDVDVVGFSGENPDWIKRTVIISKQEYQPGRQERELLQLSEADRALEFYRQMWINGKPWMLDRSVYAAKRFPGFFDRVQDDVSTYRILREAYGVDMVRSHKEISLTYATGEQSGLLECAPGAPLFRMDKVVYDGQNAPVHISSSYLKADGVIFTIDNATHRQQG